MKPLARGRKIACWLAGPLLLGAAGAAPGQHPDWRSHIWIGPPGYPNPNFPPNQEFFKWSPPDWGPYPESSYHWPTLRQALNQYGWFGRRACQKPPAAGPGLLDAVNPPEDRFPLETLPDASPALVRVLIPPDAQLWFDGNPTVQTGPLRQFETPPLSRSGSGTYQIRASWSQEGQEVSRTRVLRVYPGDRRTIDFLREGVEAKRE